MTMVAKLESCIRTSKVAGSIPTSGAAYVVAIFIYYK